MKIWLWDCLGFLLQMMPGVFLCFFPYSREEYRIPKGVAWCILSALVGAAAAGVAWIGQEIGSQSSETSIVAISYMVCFAASCLLFQSLVIRGPLLRKLLVYCFALYFYSLSFLSVNFSRVLLPEVWLHSGGVYYRKGIVLLYFLVALILSPGAYYLVRVYVFPYLKAIGPKELHSGFSLIVLLTGVYYFYLVQITVQTGFFQEEFSRREYYFCALALIVVNFCLGAAYWILFREVRRIKERSDYRSQIQIQAIQYQNIKEDIASMKRIRHDIRHERRLLEQLLTDGQVEEAKQYLRERGVESEWEEREVFCQDAAVNALLQYYVGIARGEGIHCEIRVKLDQCPVDLADMTVVLGNCLENAIIACRKVEGSKYISLKMGLVKNQVGLLLENSCQKVWTAPDGRERSGFQPAGAFQSSRQEGGNGLKSVEHAAKQCGGVAQFCFDFEKKCFITRVILKIREEKR